LNQEETERLYLRNGQVYTVSDEAPESPKSALGMPAKEGWMEHFKVWLRGWY
jgi:hypothetical protein